MELGLGGVIGGSMKRFFALGVGLVLVLSGCTNSNAANADEMENMLQDAGIGCIGPNLGEITTVDAEVLNCRSAETREKFSVAIFASTEDRDMGMSDFCFDLDRTYYPGSQVALQRSWVAYGESGATIAAIADELGAQLMPADSFCSDRGLEIGAALSDQGFQACQRIGSIYDEFYRPISTAEPYPKWSLSEDAMAMPRYAYSPIGYRGALDSNERLMKLSIRILQTDEQTPEEFRTSLETILTNGHLNLYVETRKYLNQGGKVKSWPGSFEPVLPDDWGRTKGKRDLAELERSVNAQIDLYNSTLLELDAAVLLFKLSALIVLEGCGSYARGDVKF